MVKSALAASATALLLALTACGAEGTDQEVSDPGPGTGTEDSSASPTTAPAPAVAEKRSDDEWWQASLCSRLKLGALGKATGLGKVERQLGNGFDIGIPTQRKCSVGNSDPANYDILRFGISLLPVSAEGWQQATDHLRETNDGKELATLDVGDQAVATRSVAMARVGDRVVSVDTGDVAALNPRQLRAALAAGVTAAQGLEVEGQQTIEGCAVADAEATALLGSEPTVRADFYHPAFSIPVCVWATDSAGIKVSAIPLSGVTARQKSEGYDELIDEIKAGGIYTDGEDVDLIAWAGKGDDYSAHAEFVEGQRVTRESAVALAQALANLY